MRAHSPRRTPVVLLETANVLSGIGNGIVVIAIPLLVLRETGSASLFGLIGVIAVLPTLIALPVIGAMIDRYGPRWNSVASDLVSASSVLLLSALFAVGALDVPAIIALAVLGAIIDPAGYAARRAAIAPAARASGVRPAAVNGVHDALFGLGWAFGPPLGALLVAGLGLAATFLVAGLLFVGAALAMAGVRAAGRASERRTADAGRLAELAAGLRALWRDPPLRALTVVNGVLVALYMPTEIVALPVHFERLGDPTGLAIALAALAGGYVAGAFAYGPLSRRLDATRIFRIALFGSIAFAVPLALLPPLPVLAAAAMLLGACWGPVGPLVTTLVQSRLPAGMQGRVFAVESTLTTALPPLVILAAGVGVDLWGVDPVYLAIGGATAATALIALTVPSLRQLGGSAADQAGSE